MCCSADSDIVLLRTKTAPPSESDCRYYTTARAVVVSALMPRRGGPKARARPGGNARSAPRQEKCTKYRISFCSLTRLMTRSQGRGLRLMEVDGKRRPDADRKSTRLNSSHVKISYAVFC